MPRRRPGRVVIVNDHRRAAAPRKREQGSEAYDLLAQLTRIAYEAETIADGLRQTVETICAYVRWPVGHIYLADDSDTPILRSSAIWHLEELQRFTLFREITETTIFKPGYGLIGDALLQRRLVWSPDVRVDPRFVRRSGAVDLGVRACVAFPVIAGDNVLAVYEFFSSETTSIEPQMLTLFACASLVLTQLIEREHWRAELDQLRRDLTDVERESMSSLARALAHEINSPLLAARTALDLHAADLNDRGEVSDLVACAREELARIAAIMEQVHRVAQLMPREMVNPNLQGLLERAVGE